MCGGSLTVSPKGAGRFDMYRLVGSCSCCCVCTARLGETVGEERREGKGRKEEGAGWSEEDRKGEGGWIKM